MKLLVDIHTADWLSNKEFREILSGLEDQEILFYPDYGDGKGIKMLACDRLRPVLVTELPDLELIQKLGAGVDTMFSDPDLPDHIRIARLKPAATALEMARFCLAYVLNDVQNVTFHRKCQADGQWKPKAPKRVADLRVGILGLGHIGRVVANLFIQAGFQVSGWSRTAKDLPGVTCLAGMRQLTGLLGSADYVVCVLPSTPETENLFDLARFRKMRPGTLLVNVGRGTLLNESDLIKALDRGYLRHAVLDVCRKEPLPGNDPLWHHPGITITPHVSGWDLDDGLEAVSENFRRLAASEPLLHEVDRQAGY